MTTISLLLRQNENIGYRVIKGISNDMFSYDMEQKRHTGGQKAQPRTTIIMQKIAS